MSFNSVAKKIAISLVALIILLSVIRYVGDFRRDSIDNGTGDSTLTSSTSTTPTSSTSKTTTSNQNSPSDLKIMFRVSIPKNTPKLDTIVFHAANSLLPMSKIGDYEYELEFDPEEYGIGEGGWVDYSYSRGGFSPFAEDIWKSSFEKPPRSVQVGTTHLVEDTVTGWKWFDVLNETDIPSQADNTTIVSRPEFWKGVQLPDFWSEEWEFQYDSTIDRLKRLGYEWIELSPPWEVVSEDPPVISNINTTVPAYPDAKLRRHIQEFKKEGFNIALRIQIDSRGLNSTDRDVDWWNEWYDQLNNFVKYHADLSLEEGVSALIITSPLFDDLPLYNKTPALVNASTQWSRIIDTAKTSGAKVGIETFARGASMDTTNLLPYIADGVDFFDKLDFLGVSLWGDVVNITNPSQSDFDKGMERIFEHLDYTYNQTRLPIVFPGVAYASENGSGLAKGSETFYTWDDPTLVEDRYNSQEQAMIYEAMMKQVATRDYIQGVFPFGYWYVDAPLTVDDMSIRDKMAERILVRWFDQFLTTADIQFLTNTVIRGVSNHSLVSINPQRNDIENPVVIALLIDRKRN